MQLTGDRFTCETATFGNDLSTLPNFPAEIRAPAGTLPGVSSFQLHFADHDILTPGDAPNVLVAMNPAALKANIADVPRGRRSSSTRTSSRSGPCRRWGTRRVRWRTARWTGTACPVPLTTLTVEALKGLRPLPQGGRASKNMFALGLLSWMYHRPTEGTEKFLRRSSPRSPRSPPPTSPRSGRVGTSGRRPRTSRSVTRSRRPRSRPPGTYRNISGNQALSYGLIAAGQQADLPLYLGAYPITPASDILHELSKHKNFGVRTFQAEDEIAGIGAALGAAFGGSLAVTTTSGPGVALKSETIGLAVSLELPLLVIDIQRGGPSTGLPTKTEQADLLQAMFGRNGEAPVPIVAPRTPADCFDAALEATRIALTYRTPVILLSDGYLANGAEPWAIPNVDDSRTCRWSSPPRRTTRPRTAKRACSSPTCATRRPWPARGPSRARQGCSTASAGWRRPTGPATSPTTPPTTTSWCAPGRRRSTASPPAAAHGGRRPGREHHGRVIGWGSTYGPIGAACRRIRRSGRRSPRSTCAT